jgi:hypothetical protein
MRRRFVKDTNLPIKVFSEVIFADRLRLLDKQFNTTEKWEQFTEVVDQFEDECDFFEQYDYIRESIIDHLSHSDALRYFDQDEDMSRFKLKNEGYPGNGVFKDVHVGKCLLSIDMVKANFTALRHYNPEIFHGVNTYEEFVGMFTPLDYFKKSKYVRQVIFGNIAPKRTQRYEQYLMDQVLTKIFSVTKILRKKVLYFGADEIVIDVSDFVEHGELDEKFATQINNIVSGFCDEGINVRHEYYKLVKIDGTGSGYLKQFVFDTLLTKQYEIKGVDSIEYPFVIKALNDEQLTDNDMYFLYEGRLAKLVEPIEVKFVETINCD